MEQENKTGLEVLFHQHSCSDFRWLDPREVAVRSWVRMKCRFGCRDYGKVVPCPPNLPSVPECERFFRDYQQAVLFHFAKQVAKPEERHAWTKVVNAKLLKLERTVFLAGYHKAFVIYIDPCNFCAECPASPADCLNPPIARPSLEGLAVDVFATARQCGFPIQVLTEYAQEMNRYGMLLVE